jgi:hypothetical protein
MRLIIVSAGRNPETNAAAFLGAELCRARLAAGLSQEVLARETALTGPS